MEEEQDKYPDEIFKKGHLTTIEKLLFANRYVDDLKKEVSDLNVKIGVLQSDNSELIDENNALRNQSEDIKKINSKVKAELKKDKDIQDMIAQHRHAKNKIKEFQVSNSKLICELVSLRNQLNQVNYPLP